MSRMPLALLRAVACLAIGAGCACATTVRHLDTRGLATSSKQIVIGRVESVQSYWNPAHTRIYTQVDVLVSETLKGDASDRLSLRQLGGELDGMRYNVPGCPTFRPGEEALLFVWRDPSGRAQVTGLSQGKFEIGQDAVTGERTVQRALPGMAVRDAKSLSLVASGERAPRVALDQMVREIKSALAEGGR